MWKQIAAPTFLLSLLWIATGGTTIYYVNWLYASHAQVLTENVTTIRAAGAMQDTLWRLQANLMEVGHVADDGLRTRIDRLENAFEQHLAEAEATAITPEEKVLVGEIREQFALHCDCARRVLEIGGNSARAVEAMSLARAVAQPCKELIAVNERLMTEAGSRRWRLGVLFNLVLVAFLIAGPAIGIVGGLWVARDVHRTLSQADRLAAVGELAAGVAHELRNPLTAVKLLIQTAGQQRPAGTLNAKQLQVVQDEITRMENTIQGLLDFARPPAPRRVRHDVRDTLRRALNLVAGRARQQGVTVEETWPAEPVRVDADPEQLHQVFVNLLLNGIDATPSGGQLKVRLSGATETRARVRIEFADTGSGFSPAVLERVFEPFVTDKERGTGLGLAVSRRIVQSHEGTLVAANRDGGGAVLTVTLPCVAEKSEIRSTKSETNPSDN